MEQVKASEKPKRGIDEKTVRSVVQKYLEIHRKIRTKPTRGAGPDFIFNGEIVETKGSKFGFDRAVKQMLDYASKYRELSLALPAEAFTAQRVMQLNALGKIIYKQHSRSLKLICVLAEPQQGTYRIGEHYAHTLAYNVAEAIGDFREWSFPETEAKPKNYESGMIRNIDSLVQSAIMRLIRQATDARNIYL